MKTYFAVATDMRIVNEAGFWTEGEVMEWRDWVENVEKWKVEEQR